MDDKKLPWKVIPNGKYGFERIEFTNEISVEDLRVFAGNLEKICGHLDLGGEDRIKLGRGMLLRIVPDEQCRAGGVMFGEGNLIAVEIPERNIKDLNTLSHELFHGFDARLHSDFYKVKSLEFNDQWKPRTISQIADYTKEKEVCGIIVKKLGTDQEILDRLTIQYKEKKKEELLSQGRSGIVASLLSKREKCEEIPYFERKDEVLARAFAWKVSGVNSYEKHPDYETFDTEERLNDVFEASDLIAKSAMESSPVMSLKEKSERVAHSVDVDTSKIEVAGLVNRLKDKIQTNQAVAHSYAPSQR